MGHFWSDICLLEAAGVAAARGQEDAGKSAMTDEEPVNECGARPKQKWPQSKVQDQPDNLICLTKRPPAAPRFRSQDSPSGTP